MLLTLNNGQSCCSDSHNSFLLWVLESFSRRRYISSLVWRNTDGNKTSQQLLFKSSRFAASFMSSDCLSPFALKISFFNNPIWKSWTLLSSKHPLLGIRNLRNFGMICAFKQFCRNDKRRLLLSTLRNAVRYWRKCNQQSIRLQKLLRLLAFQCHD